MGGTSLPIHHAGYSLVLSARHCIFVESQHAEGWTVFGVVLWQREATTYKMGKARACGGVTRACESIMLDLIHLP